MSLPNNLGAYANEIEIFDQALADPKGVRVCYVEQNKARHAQHRFNQARALDREQSKRIYPRDTPKWGRSAYDALVCRVRDDAAGEWWVYIEHSSLDIKAVEPLSEDTDASLS